MQRFESLANRGNIFQAVGNRDLKKLDNGSINTKDEAFEKMQKLEFMEFKNQYINENKGKIEGLGQAWLKHCLMVKQGQKESPILAELFKNEGFFHQVFTRSAVKAFSLGYIYEKENSAFNKGGKFDITKFIGFVEKINKQVASYILPRYLNNIKKENDKVQLGKCRLFLNLENIKAKEDTKKVDFEKIKFPSLSIIAKKEIDNSYSFQYNGYQKFKELNEKDAIVGLKKEGSTASEEEQGKLELKDVGNLNVSSLANVEIIQPLIKDSPREEISENKLCEISQKSAELDKSEEISIKGSKSLVDKHKDMMRSYIKKLETTSLAKQELDKYTGSAPNNSMIILQQGLKNLGIIKAEKNDKKHKAILFKGSNGYEVKAVLDKWNASPTIIYEFIEIITPSNKGMQTKILIIFNNNNAIPSYDAGTYPFIRKELFNKDKYDLVMIMDGSSPKRKIKLSLEKMGHFMPLIIDNKNNRKFAIDPKGSLVTYFSRPHPINDVIINKLIPTIPGNSELEENKNISTFEELIEDMRNEELTKDKVNLINSTMKRENFPVKAMGIQGMTSTNCVRLGAFISLEILVQYLDKQSIDLGAITKHLNSFGENSVASIANLFVHEWTQDFTENQLESSDTSNHIIKMEDEFGAF